MSNYTKSLNMGAIGEEKRDRLERNDIDDDLSDDDDDGEELTFWEALRQGLRNTKKTVMREMDDYGPPYVDNKTLYPDDLIFECSALKPNNIKIHNLLNLRANPVNNLKLF
jgi:hypothetical protein